MTEQEPPAPPGRRPRAFELADPTAAPDPGWTPGPVERTVRRMAAAARPWMAIPALVLALAVAAAVPVSAVIEHPGEVLVASDWVSAVATDQRRPPPEPVTGAFLMPRRDPSSSALDWLLAQVRPGTVAVAGEPELVHDWEPIESALVMGAGVAPGRGTAQQLGLEAVVDHPGVTAASLGLSLELFDQVASVDLSRDRRILALGALTAEGGLSCGADPAASLRAIDGEVDVVLLGADCSEAGIQDAAPGALILRAGSLPDALVELSG